MRYSSLAVVCVVGLLGTTALASSDPAPATAAPAAQPAADPVDPNVDPNEIICRQMAPTTGTRLGGSRECHTRKQWDDAQQQHAADVRNMQNGGAMAGHPGE